jgi:predicted ribonuclease YlaK
MSTHALNFIQKGIYEKVIFTRNNHGVRDSKEVGFLPGDLNEKLLPFAMPLADHVGGIEGLKMLISQGKIELQHLGFIRGRDIKNSIIYCSEAENLTKEHIQLLISRVAEGSTLWLNGDFKQTDNDMFDRNSGLRQMINSLKGNSLFGCVELNITERSKTAQLAELLD